MPSPWDDEIAEVQRCNAERRSGVKKAMISVAEKSYKKGLWRGFNFGWWLAVAFVNTIWFFFS